MAFKGFSKGKAFDHASLFQLDGDIPLLRAVPYGIQHILAMFV
ncbi:MAG: hypothetical protein ACLRX5_09355 [Slackia sp.]